MKKTQDWLTTAALGAAAGFAGTLMLQILRVANQRWVPQTMSPIRQDPGGFMVETVEEALPFSVRQHIPETLETGAAQSLAVGYGLTFGALYAALQPTGGPVLKDGLVLDVTAWAVGYLGWLPALGLMPPVWKQRPAQIVNALVQHAVYGLATVAVYERLQKRGEHEAEL
jgi:hypothetical protein